MISRAARTQSQEERDLLKKATVFFARQQPWGLRSLKSTNPQSQLVGCDVNSRGLRAFRSRPPSRRQRSGLAHIKEQPRPSPGRNVRPWMVEELKETGLDVGHRLWAG